MTRAETVDCTRKHDPVDRPSHYVDGRRFETIDVLEDWFAENPWLWNAAKYLSRAGRKGDAVTDLRKAVWYIQRYMRHLEETR